MLEHAEVCNGIEAFCSFLTPVLLTHVLTTQVLKRLRAVPSSMTWSPHDLMQLVEKYNQCIEYPDIYDVTKIKLHSKSAVAVARFIRAIHASSDEYLKRRFPLDPSNPVWSTEDIQDLGHQLNNDVNVHTL